MKWSDSLYFFLVASWDFSCVYSLHCLRIIGGLYIHIYTYPCLYVMRFPMNCRYEALCGTQMAPGAFNKGDYLKLKKIMSHTTYNSRENRNDAQ